MAYLNGHQFVDPLVYLPVRQAGDLVEENPSRHKHTLDSLAEKCPREQNTHLSLVHQKVNSVQTIYFYEREMSH
jgi:hypothetical protein